jgi:ABC-type transporter Mla subunit MlaD
MRIFKFNEAELSEISPDRVSEIIENMSTISNDVRQKQESIDALINELGNFKTSNKSSNDQIDDSISSLEILRKLLGDSLDKMDNVVINMKDYSKDGRKYLY